MCADANPRLGLIVGAARSGTTLTRLLLNAHPDIACPAEAGLPALMGHMLRVWATVHADEIGRSERHDPGLVNQDDQIPTRFEQLPGSAVPAITPEALNSAPDLPDQARQWVTSTIRDLMGRYCAEGGEAVYCDKSLDSVHYLAPTRALFPEVRVIVVVRHVMDTVASGIEASPWGFQAYGYDSYVQTSPGNWVAALAGYWLDHVTQALAWEKQHPELCHRVRYEDLVLAPEKTVCGIQQFLGVREDPAVLASAFEREPPRGPGDYKVEHTSGVHAASIGHGKRVPMTMLPPPLLQALNEKLEALGYAPMDSGWNAAERLVDGGAVGPWADRLAQLMGRLSEAPPHGDSGSFAVVAEDHHALRWVVDPQLCSVEQGDGDVDAVLTGTAQDLVLMMTGEENLGVLLRTGRLRHVVADDERGQRDLMREISSAVEVLRERIVTGKAPVTSRPAG